MDILQQPLLTKKNTALTKRNTYTFVVHKKANKVEIAKEVEDAYGVNVLRVNTQNCPPHAKQRHTRRGTTKGQTPGYKKALITLKKGETLDLYSVSQ